ncbi:unnamed protein product [Meganyctiphanes norvegica]|uniref:TPX2 C-terminal domain-containing protein n=1 Tax=Meganyctiphanes norvegica TaxID=48144 RepID=A0AAV2QVZ8_MEGNR
MSEYRDDAWEFDAPMHVFDFTKPDEPDDSYFDAPSEGRKSSCSRTLETPPFKTSNTSQVAIETNSPSEMERNSDVESTDTKVNTPVTPNAPETEEKLTTPNVEARPPIRVTPKRKFSADDEIIDGAPTRESPRLRAIAKAVRRSNADLRMSVEQFRHRRDSHGGKSGNNSLPEPNLSKVTKQKLQKPMIHKATGSGPLSQGDLNDLKSIAVIRGKIAQNRTTKTNPTRPTVTKTKEFNFATDNRVKRTQSDSDTSKNNEMSFSKSLRSTGTPPKSGQPSRTVVQPFNLTEARKRKQSDELGNFVSMAELNMKYFTRTPTRFRAAKHGSVESLNSDKGSKRPDGGVTIPHTPQLSTRTRSRQTHVLTSEEREQLEFEEAKKKSFKAKPLNKKVFEAPENLRVMEKKAATVPEPFNITDAKKMPNANALLRDFGGSTSSLASIPHGGIDAYWTNRTTKPTPFSFHSRDQITQKKKEATIKKVLEEEKKQAEFHANPMPVFEGKGPLGVPPKASPRATKPKPFNLQIDARGAVKKQMWQKEIEDQEREEREKRNFHARTESAVHKPAFIPEKSNKPLTDISGFTLNTDKRAEERKEYDQYLKQREAEMLAAKKSQDEQKLADELAVADKQRKAAVHKARPMPQYKELKIKPSETKPTVAIAPNFATDTRIRVRHGSSGDTSCDSNSTFAS